MQTEAGTYDLRRRPHRDHSPLQAWDSADLLALDHLVTNGSEADPPLLLVNDRFGALAVALADRGPVSFTDSAITQLATAANLERNQRASDAVSFWKAGRDAPAEGPFGTVIIKIPKSLDLLEYQLRMIRPVLAEDAQIIGAAKVNHIHTSTLDRFTSILGPTSTSLAKRKSRLIFTTVDPDLIPPPVDAAHSYQTPPLGESSDLAVTTVARPGVFSGRKLDPGARLLLEALPQVMAEQQPDSVVDLGCGNGVLGTAAAMLGQAQGRRPALTFVDESELAVISAGETWTASIADGEARFLADDRLNQQVGPVDLVLNNPPFHQEHAIDELTAWLMFSDAKKALSPTGALVVVANRHLGHHARLRKQFGNCEVMASTSKFVVLRARMSGN